MAFIADENYDFTTWDYVLGEFYKNMSIATDRYYYLQDLNEPSLKIALHDPETKYWTKWVEFPAFLFDSPPDGYGGHKYSRITAAIDVHRSILPNEIVIESDYLCEECKLKKKKQEVPIHGCLDCYTLNYEAARYIGELVETKGFEPLYYYSGNKSLHVHVFFNWDCLKSLDTLLQDQLRLQFRDSKLRFKRKFIIWLRTKMISCWETYTKEFDTDLIKATHLIRCELSKNKAGYKTFLGYSYKDLSFIPYVCNEKNRIYPKLGKIKLSSPKEITGLIEEFIESLTAKERKVILKKRENRTLGDWGMGEQKESLRECVKVILSDEFQKVGDGKHRAMFVLVNELRRVFGDVQARAKINEWNEKMNFSLTDAEIDYRFKRKIYPYISSKYICNLLGELGIEITNKPKHKAYKP